MASLYSQSIDSLLDLQAQPAQAKPPGGTPYGYELVRLPRGDAKPLTTLEADLLEKTLVVLRARGASQHFADSLARNIDSFHKGVLVTESRQAPPGEKIKSKAV
jgi:hypothetical protein